MTTPACLRVYRDDQRHGVVLAIGHQSFCVNDPTDEGEAHARWLADQLAAALRRTGAHVDILAGVGSRFSRAPAEEPT